MSKAKRKCLNIGSGIDYKKSTETETWVNFDINPEVKPDIEGDVEQLDKYFKENEFDEVHLIHVWEHCPDLMGVMEQIWRVLKPEGKLCVACPYYTGRWACGDPTHIHVIGEHTFSFLSYPKYEENAKGQTHMSQLFPQCDFDIVKLVLIQPKESEAFKNQEFAVKHYFNVIDEIQAELKAVKPLRTFDIKQYQSR